MDTVERVVDSPKRKRGAALECFDDVLDIQHGRKVQGSARKKRRKENGGMKGGLVQSKIELFLIKFPGLSKPTNSNITTERAGKRKMCENYNSNDSVSPARKWRKIPDDLPGD